MKIIIYRNFITILLISTLLMISGCSKSVIKIESVNVNEGYSMFGRVPSRDFSYAGMLSDSIVLKWQGETNGSFPASTVTVHDHFVFVNDLSGRIFCFDINTGKRAGQLKQTGSVFTAPVIDGFKVMYISTISNSINSELAIYDFSNGKFIANKDNIAGKVISEMIKVDKNILFVTEAGRIYSYNFVGYKNYEYNVKTYTHSSPAYKNDVMVFGNDDGELIGFNIKLEKIIYRNKISSVLLSGVSISGSTVFVGDYYGTVYAADLLTGNVIWSFKTGNRIEMIPAFDDETVFAGNLGGGLFALEKTTGNLKWETATNGLLNAAPLVSDNLLIVPDNNKKLHFINKHNGNIQKSMQFDGRLKLTPVYFNNLLFIGYDDGLLEAYEFIF